MPFRMKTVDAHCRRRGHAWEHLPYFGRVCSRCHLLDADFGYTEDELVRACALGDAQTLEVFLLEASADVTSKRVFHGTPIEAAVKSGSPECVDLLLGAGADPDQRNDRHENTLHWAVEDGGPEQVAARIIQRLIGAGASPNVLDERSQTPLDLALLLNRKRLAELLVRHGAKLGRDGGMRSVDTDRFEMAVSYATGADDDGDESKLPRAVPLSQEARALFLAHAVPEDLTTFLTAHAYERELALGGVFFGAVNDLPEENLEEGQQGCVACGLLIIGRGLTGDPIVVDVHSGSVGFVYHDRLWGDPETDPRTILVDTRMDVGSFYLAAAKFGEMFPADAYAAAGVGDTFPSRFPL